MELHDICDGCGRRHGFCICSFSVGSDGFITVHPNPVNLASKLRIIAANARVQEKQIQTKNAADKIRDRALWSAKQGYSDLDIWIKDMYLSKEAAEIVAKELE